MPVTLGVLICMIVVANIRGNTAQRDVNTLRKCANITAYVECSTGSARDVANVYYVCNEPITAEQFYRFYCSRNTKNLYCGTAYYYLMDVQSATSACATSATNCTDDCRSRLMNLRDQLGCCLNLYFNNTLAFADFGQTFSYSFWRNCGIEPLLADQNCTAQPKVIIPSVDRECDNAEERLPSFVCSASYRDALTNALSQDSDCKGFENVRLERCGMNENGDSCLGTPSLYHHASRAAVSCSELNTCDPDCLLILQRLNESAQCCINSFVNTTFFRHIGLTFDYLSYEYWKMCNLTTPGTCLLKFESGAVSVMRTNAVQLITVLYMILFSIMILSG